MLQSDIIQSGAFSLLGPSLHSVTPSPICMIWVEFDGVYFLGLWWGNNPYIVEKPVTCFFVLAPDQKDEKHNF